MKTCASCRTDKPLEEFHKHSARRDGRNSYCKPCAIQRSLDWATDNRGRALAKGAAWRAANPDYMRQRYLEKVDSERARSAKYAREHAAERREAHRAWRESNRLRVRQREKEWRMKNPHYMAAMTARRRAAENLATVKWANKFFMAEAYDLAKLRSIATGYEWQVDHIVPLRSKLVCGLHVESNLQVIPAVRNASKGNRFWPEMWGERHG